MEIFPQTSFRAQRVSVQKIQSGNERINLTVLSPTYCGRIMSKQHETQLIIIIGQCPPRQISIEF